MIKSNGFTLFEVLIALVVLSVGLLGLAGLQALSLRNNHAAYLRSQAALQASDMGDRMRANLAGLANYNALSGSAYTDPGCISTGCTPAQMAQFDAYQWTANLAALLPSGTGSVDVGAASGVSDCSGNAVTDANYYVIKVNWVELDKSQAVTHCFALSLRPK